MSATTAALPGAVGHPTVPARLVEEFAHRFAVVQQELARCWELAADLDSAVGHELAEWVGDDLALLMRVHPQTGAALVTKASLARRLPGLMQAWKAQEITDRHVLAVCDEVVRWAPDDEAVQGRVVELALVRTRAWVAAGRDRLWPAPGELRRRVRAAALVLDASATEQAKRSAADRRGVQCYPSGVGEGTVLLRGPEAQAAWMRAGIEARAAALHALPGNERTLEQCRFDAAYELLCADADHTEPGQPSTVPTTGPDGLPAVIRPRGVAMQVTCPVSVAQGGDLELAEIEGYGPILPSTARDLLAMAEHLQTIAVDSETGAVVQVSDRTPVPLPELDPADIGSPTKVSQALLETASTQLEWLLAASLQRRLQTLSTDGYRPHRRLSRHVKARDRYCTFPNCPYPAGQCDLDHAIPHPQGPTDETNLHSPCRHHHRGKQAYFTVRIDPQTRDVIWTTPDGRTYRRPPPEY